ncbi:MAG TPA: hypothetical protein VHB54_21585 [Mucilaginibacter sp.]|nr:hypothetical protein [Mucilaginibacter sp.]
MKFVKIFVAALAVVCLQVATVSAQTKHHHWKHHKMHHRIHRQK